jgi:uncharacterized membrane protein
MTLLPQETPARARSLWIVGTLSSVAIALASYRYLFGVGPMPNTVVANGFSDPWLLVHVASSATALLIGSFQFAAPIRARWPRHHRWSGRLYVATCLVGGVSGQILAWGTTAGPVAAVGFGLLSALWLWTTLRGWQLAMQHDFIEHRRWMIRSWALTLAGVTLRVQLGVAMALEIPFETSYPVIAYLCWVPNLVVGELCLIRDRRRSRRQARSAPVR